MIFKNSQQCGSEQGKWRGKENIYNTSYNKHYIKKIKQPHNSEKDKTVFIRKMIKKYIL